MALTTGALLVFALVGLALLLFVTEWLPADITAIGVLVSLAVLEPYTGVPAADALLGFASPAVITIIGMYILSEGVQETNVVAWLGAHLGRLTRDSDGRLLSTTLGSTGLAAGIVNNTPVVAVLIPLLTELSDDRGLSPSKFLLPMSFAAMLGGTLTLVGSSINLLASDVAVQSVGRPIGMFEFTPLGVLVLGVGLLYLGTVGYRLTPARVAPQTGFAEEYDLERHLAQVVVRDGSPLVGHTPTEVFLDADLALDLDILQVHRERAEPSEEAPDGTPVERTVTETYVAGSDREIAAGDRLTLRANPQVLNRFADDYDCRQLPRAAVDVGAVAAADHPGALAEVIVPPDSDLLDETPADARLLQRYDVTVLALRRGDELRREGLSETRFRTGDTLLVQTTERSLEHLLEDGDVILSETVRPDAVLPRFERPLPDLDVRAPLSVAILLGVVGVGAFTPVAIPIAALGGVVAMVATGCLRPGDAYDAVSWNVVFLLAGLLPLGVALQRTGGATAIADGLGLLVAGLPAVLALAAVYLIASLLAATITPVATVVLLGPVAADLAAVIGADAFAFVLATLFGASAAFLTPVGYQTNLMVYGPGAYRFTDYARVGAPLLAVLTVVTTAGIVVLYGL